MDITEIIRQRIYQVFHKYNIVDFRKADKIFAHLVSYRTPEQLTEYATVLSDEQFYAVIKQADFELMNSSINHNAAYNHMPPSNHSPRPPPPPHPTSNEFLGNQLHLPVSSSSNYRRLNAAAAPFVPLNDRYSRLVASTSSFRGPTAWHDPRLTSNAQLGGGLDSRGGSMIRSPAAAPPGIMPPSGMRSPAAPAPSPIFRLVASTSSNIHHYSYPQLGGGLDSMRSPAAAPPGIIPPSGMRSPAEACRFFNSGFCRKGKSCTFPHVFIPDHGISQDDDISSGGPRGQLSVVLAEDALKYNKEKSALYLTFPSESTFTEEDVMNYFEQFGPVLEVRIPYREKRVFGFVSFRFPETVNGILGMNQPHLIGSSSVMAKRYKEKTQVYERPPHGPHSVVLAEDAAPKCNNEKSTLFITFSPESTFTKDDVINYFTSFGPVLDVQFPRLIIGRTFGYVNFQNPETVTKILERKNPHFICSQCVVAEPYKESEYLEKAEPSHRFLQDTNTGVSNS